MDGANIVPKQQGSLPISPSRIEERRAPRYTLLLRQAKLRMRQGEFLCVIRDLSVSGISIRTFHPLPSGDRLAIELREGCPYLIEKVWEREGEAGFQFRDAVALDEMLEDDARFPRRPLRMAVDIPVDIRSGAETGQGLLTNLSQQGGRLEAGEIWARGQLLRLDMAGFPSRYAKVRWRRDLTHGLVFEETLSLRDFAYLLAQLHNVI